MKNIMAKIAAFLTTTMLIIPAYASNLEIDLGDRPSLGKDVTAGDSDVQSFFTNFKALAVAIGGLCTIVSLVHFIISITRLSVSASNDQMRNKAIKSILISGISLMLFGGMTTIVGIFWNYL